MAAVISGPAIMTGRRPTRSIIQPVGRVPIAPPITKAVSTKLAWPKLTSNDLAITGMAGKAMPVPEASSTAGEEIERKAPPGVALASSGGGGVGPAPDEVCGLAPI